jgi:hypothetical protein
MNQKYFLFYRYKFYLFEQQFVHELLLAQMLSTLDWYQNLFASQTMNYYLEQQE